MILKPLFYIALIYLVYKVYRLLKQNRVEMHYHDHRTVYQSENKNPADAGFKKNKQSDEYTDFEEIKD